MAFEYEHFTEKHKRDWLKGRITQLESEHFGHSMHKISAEAAGEAESVEQHTAIVRALEKGIAALKDEYAKLPPEDEEAPTV